MKNRPIGRENVYSIMLGLKLVELTDSDSELIIVYRIARNKLGTAALADSKAIHAVDK